MVGYGLVLGSEKFERTESEFQKYCEIGTHLNSGSWTGRKSDVGGEVDAVVGETAGNADCVPASLVQNPATSEGYRSLKQHIFCLLEVTPHRIASEGVPIDEGVKLWRDNQYGRIFDH